MIFFVRQKSSKTNELRKLHVKVTLLISDSLSAKYYINQLSKYFLILRSGNKAVYTAYIAPRRPKSKNITYGLTDRELEGVFYIQCHKLSGFLQWYRPYIQHAHMLLQFAL